MPGIRTTAVKAHEFVTPKWAPSFEIHSQRYGFPESPVRAALTIMGIQSRGKLEFRRIGGWSCDNPKMDEMFAMLKRTVREKGVKEVSGLAREVTLIFDGAGTEQSKAVGFAVQVNFDDTIVISMDAAKSTVVPKQQAGTGYDAIGA